MKFIIDNALSPKISDGLKQVGYDSVHVREIGMEKATDKDIIKYAFENDRIIVSADTDFGTLLVLHDLAKPSFILFRKTNKKSLFLLNELLANLEQIQASLIMGAIIVFEDERIRVRYLPIR